MPDPGDNPDTGFPEESELLRLFGDFSDPVPVIQVVSHTDDDSLIHISNFLERHSVPFSVLDSCVFTETRGGSPSPLLHHTWSGFVMNLVKSICACFPLDNTRCSKLKQCEVKNSQDFVKLMNNIMVSSYDFNPLGRVKCMVIMVKSYHELMSSEPTLLNTILRLHEKIENIRVPEKSYRKKIVVVLMGPYPVPREVYKNDFTMPIVYMSVMPQKLRADKIKARGREYAISKGKQMIEASKEEHIEQLWEVYVDYFIDVLYPWYATESETLYMYSRILWQDFLEPLQGCQPDALDNLMAVIPNLCRSIDPNLRNATTHYKSRFISDIKDTSNMVTGIVSKQLYKFHGSRVSKYLLVGAAMATFSDPKAISHKLRGGKKRLRPESNMWRTRRSFDLMAWIANTEWVFAENESETLMMDHVFYTQLMWIVEEGYVRQYSNMNNWKLLPASCSSRLWHVTDCLPSTDSSWRETHLHGSNASTEMHLNNMMNNSSRFLLCASKEMVMSAAKDLNVSMDDVIIL